MLRRSESHTVSATADHRKLFATPIRMVPAGRSESLPVVQISQTPSAKFASSPEDPTVQSAERPEIQQTLSVESSPTRKKGAAVVPADISRGSSLGRSDCFTLIINGNAGGRHSREVEAHAIGCSVRDVPWEAFGARVEGSSRQMELPS